MNFENHSIAESGVKRISELVFNINEAGGNLMLNLSKIGLSIADVDNGCEQFLQFDGSNTIYFGEYWEEKLEERINEAIRQLEDYKGEL